VTRRLRPLGRSLFWRLMLGFGSVVIVLLLATSLVLSDYIRSALGRQVGDVMQQDAEGVALWAAPHMGKASVPQDVLPHLPWLNGLTDGRLLLINREGVVVADTGTITVAGTVRRNFEGERLDHDWVRRVLDGVVIEQYTPDPWMGAAITVGRPITYDGRVVGAAFLFNAPSRLQDAALEFRWLIAVTVLAAATAGLLAAYTLARSFARPIEQIARFATGLGQRRFFGTLPPTGITELEKLADALASSGNQLQTAFEELSEEQQRMQALIHDMAEGVVAVDEDRKVLLVNPAAAQLLGLPGPFDGLDVNAVGFPAALTDALSQGVEQPVSDIVHFRCGAAEISARISQVAVESGRTFGAVALLRDETVEVQLRRMRENFVANVSHELRGPLAALSAGVEAMHDGLIPPDNRPRYLTGMLAEIGRLRRLVDNLLELSRLDAGMLDIPQEEFDLAPLCEGLLEIWEPRAATAQVTLQSQCPSLRVVANYDRVEEVLTNFLDNALRFTPAGGTIRLFARAEGDMVRLGVQDTGVGISKEHLPHLWERFFKADPARTRAKGAGTGLGLSICRQLVEHMGGEVSVQSTPGKGSTFSITLVAARPQTQ
jgi:signal transduction histidine kinase